MKFSRAKNLMPLSTPLREDSRYITVVTAMTANITGAPTVRPYTCFRQEVTRPMKVPSVPTMASASASTADMSTRAATPGRLALSPNRGDRVLEMVRGFFLL